MVKDACLYPISFFFKQLCTVSFFLNNGKILFQKETKHKECYGDPKQKQQGV
jgi:hypothetical protein